MKSGNADEGKAVRPTRVQDAESPTLSGGSSVLDRLERITERATTHPEEVFNNLYSLLNYELLWYAFRRLKRGKVPGVDGRTVEDYEEDLQSNLMDLLDRLHCGSYRPKLRGHYQYYGINDNWPMLMAYRNKARVMVKGHFSRRSQNSYVNWTHLGRLTERYPLANPHRLVDLIAMSRESLSAV